MNTLIIGGTKYFGKAIVRKFLARGDSVTIYSRGNVKPDFWDDVDHIQGDRTEHDDFVRKLRGKTFDVVVDNQAFRVADARAVVKALQGRAGKYLFASTISIYGGLGHAHQWRSADRKATHVDQFVDLDARFPLREEDADVSAISWEYDNELSGYAQGKRQVERYLQETRDFPWVSMRIPPVLGPEDPSLRFWWYLQRILDGQEIILRDGGSATFRNGFSEDIAQAFLDAADSPRAVNQIYHICQREIVTLKRFVEVIGEAAGRELNAVSVPGDVCETKSDLPWREWRFDPFSRPPAYAMSVEKARRDFGMRTTSMAEWVRRTVDWYSEHHDGADSAFYERRDDEVRFARWWRDSYARFLETAAAARG